MAALNFPLTPIVGQKYPDPGIPGLPVYTWDGEKWTTYGGSAPVAGLPGTTLPKPNANPAEVGTSVAYAREDHVHPLDSGYVLKTGDEMTGPLVMLSGDPVDDLQVATKKYVDDVVLAGGGAPPGNTAPLADGVAAAGVATPYSRSDHVHPTDTNRQPADADLTAIAALSSTGIVRRTTVGSTWTAGDPVANAELAQMPGFSFKVNNNAGLAVPTDIAITALTTKPAPGGADFLLLSDQSASGSLKKITINSLPGSSGGVAEAPNDGKQYGRQSLGWSEILGGGATPSDTLPLENGTADAGTATALSRGDHRHPSDTSRAPLASPVFTGNPTAPPPVDEDGLSIATTAFVMDAVEAAAGSVTPSDTNPLINGVAAPGSAATYSRGDHVHPTDTSRAAASAVPAGATVAPLVDAAVAVVGVATKYAREDHVHPLPAGIALLSVDNTWTGIQGYAETVLTPTSPITWNVDAAPVATVDLNTGATTMNAPTNVVAGRVYTIRMFGTTSTVVWNTAFDFAGNATPTVSPIGVDRFTFIGRAGGVLEEIGRSQNIGSP